MAKLSDLPEELLVLIFEEVAARVSPESARRHFLRTVCLLARKFRYPGQCNLWESVQIEGPRDSFDTRVQGFIEIQREKTLATTTLILSGVSGRDVEEVVGVVHGVKRLVLDNITTCIDAKILFAKSLAQLKELHLVFAKFAPYLPTTTEFNLPFHLDHISTDFWGLDQPPYSHERLGQFAALFNSSVCSATYDMSFLTRPISRGPYINRIWDAVSASAPQLRKLDLRETRSAHDDRFDSALKTFLGNCHLLVNLSIDFNSLELVEYLVRDLEVLKIHFFGPGSRGTAMRRIADLLKEGQRPGALKVLERLVIQDTIIKVVYTKGEGRNELVRVCEKNKIALEWKEDV